MSAAKNRTALVLGGEPRVELLPPEVALREKAKSMRRIAALGVLAAVVVVGGGYTLASLNNASAQTALTEAQGRTNALLAEQQKYAKVTTATSLTDNVVVARSLNASTEVLWGTLMSEVSATLPAGVSIESATMKGRSPWEPALVAAGPLRSPRVATVSMVISSPTIFDVTAIVRGLGAVPGFADATPDSISFDTSYKSTITFDVNEKALSGRFAKDAEASK